MMWRLAVTFLLKMEDHKPEEYVELRVDDKTTMKVEEHFDVLDENGNLTGKTKARSAVHRDGDFHRAVHVWIFAESTKELLLQKRSDDKDSWAGLWDISSAGHISAGDASLNSARRELAEELGVTLPAEAFEFLFVYLQQSVTNEGTFVNNEYNDVYLITTADPIPLEAFELQESEVSAVKYMPYREYIEALRKGDPAYVDYETDGPYGKFFQTLAERYDGDAVKREEKLKKQVARYVPVKLTAEMGQLSKGDKTALEKIVEAAHQMDSIFLEQLWGTNPALKKHLMDTASKEGATSFDKLKLVYYLINKGPWSLLDDGEAFLSSADSALVLAPDAVKKVPGFEGLRYRAAFPATKPPGSNFYPADMSKQEFEEWKESHCMEKVAEATGFFTVIRRPSDVTDATHSPASTSGDRDLRVIPYSKQYNAGLQIAVKKLLEAAQVAENPSLQKYLKARAAAFLSNDYYEADVAWMDLNSPVDVTMGPYETYKDGLFGYKATFEAYIGIKDEDATEKVELFGHHLQELENHLPMDDKHKKKGVTAAPIRVIQLAFNSGDVGGAQTLAFNLPNDERIKKERGTAMVMMKNVNQAKFDSILLPIAKVLIDPSQQSLVDFDSFFTHTLCHECCHGIGPSNITLPDGTATTVRKELQELYSPLEEAKADIVGLWALHYLLDKGFLPASLEQSMYVAFLAGCFRSVRFGLAEAHGWGQAVQFNFLLEKGGFKSNNDGTFWVDFGKVRQAVEDLGHVILTLQANGDKEGGRSLLAKYGVLTPELGGALERLKAVEVPIDIAPYFDLP
ncbi:nudix hydrolase 3 [Klebsormidium nitens]|uniref:Nudix hydrolase 3 n=1 Tax=Klebsormidium nitens TaxID=105231 RepID=A0A1Y1IDV6_KLENI|nr:nudix hydrolase 3 [Klebsormidium nitens]|eukprot:GAQ86886.1 nudix hydrolase 3 [Klebsormidium nitens]